MGSATDSRTYCPQGSIQSGLLEWDSADRQRYSVCSLTGGTTLLSFPPSLSFFFTLMVILLGIIDSKVITNKIVPCKGKVDI